MTMMETNYKKALALQKEVHGKYSIPDWIQDFLHEASRDSVQIQHRSSHDEQVTNMTKLCSWMIDIGYSLGRGPQYNMDKTVVVANAILLAGMKMMGVEEYNKTTKEILEIQQDVGVKECPEEKYVKWALATLSPALAALVMGSSEEYSKSIGAVLVAFYILGKYDAMAENVPEAFDFKGLDKILKGLGE